MNDHDLRERIEHLAYRIELLMSVSDSERAPFEYHMLEANATEKQVKAVFALMDDYWTKVKAGTETRSHGAFEQRVYEIFPESAGDYHFAEGIVRTLRRERRYIELYDYMMKSGMNLHPIED